MYLDLILIDQETSYDRLSAGHGQSLRALATEVWNGVLFVFAPLTVLASFGYFLLLAFETEANGWSSVDEQRPKILASLIPRST